MASLFWVGGTGTWDNASTTHWSTSSGGASGSGPPTSADTVTFDGSSGGGTVTVAATFNGTNTIVGLTFGAFTGTLDFATNNPNVTITTTFSGTGTGTRTLSMGNGVWTFGGGTSAAWNFLTTTNLTLNINSSTIVWQPATSGSSFFGGAKTWGALTINANSSTPNVLYQIEPGNTANNTFASLTVNAPANISIRAGATQTFTGGITVSGSSISNMVGFFGDGVSSTSGTIAVGATSNVAYTAWRGITGATSSINATNSINLGNPTLGTLSISTPSGGGVTGVIGG